MRPRPGAIIVLHGASSAGKSTLARALQSALPVPFWHWSIDHIRDAGVLPASRFKTGEFQWSQMRPSFFEGFHRSIEGFAAAGNNLIVEHILEDAQMREDVLARLAPFHPFWVGLHTPLATLEAREAARGDRRIGSAAEDFTRIHHAMPYHLELDGTADAATNAQRVRSAWIDHTSQ